MNKKETEYIINPLTRRSIKIGGRIFHTLFLSGYFKNEEYTKFNKSNKTKSIKKKYKVEYKVEDTELETTELETTELETTEFETSEIDEYNIETDESCETDETDN